MAVDWRKLAEEVGDSATDGIAYLALEKIIGEESISDAVEIAVRHEGSGAELVEGVLRIIQSRRAAELAYEIYKTSDGDRARMAVRLIKGIAHPVSRLWVREFLDDDNVAGWGVGLLENLLYRGMPVDELEEELKVAELHPLPGVRKHAGWIREGIAADQERATT